MSDDDYTPTTEEVRKDYAEGGHYRSIADRGPEFDRWLAAERSKAVAAFIDRQSVMYRKHSALAIEEDIELAVAEFGVSREWFYEETT